MTNYKENQPSNDRQNKTSKDPNFNVTADKGREDKKRPSSDRDEQQRSSHQQEKRKANY